MNKKCIIVLIIILLIFGICNKVINATYVYSINKSDFEKVINTEWEIVSDCSKESSFRLNILHYKMRTYSYVWTKSIFGTVPMLYSETMSNFNDFLSDDKAYILSYKFIDGTSMLILFELNKKGNELLGLCSYTNIEGITKLSVLTGNKIIEEEEYDLFTLMKD